MKSGTYFTSRDARTGEAVPDRIMPDGSKAYLVYENSTAVAVEATRLQTPLTAQAVTINAGEPAMPEAAANG